MTNIIFIYLHSWYLSLFLNRQKFWFIFYPQAPPMVPAQFQPHIGHEMCQKYIGPTIFCPVYCTKYIAPKYIRHETQNRPQQQTCYKFTFQKASPKTSFLPRIATTWMRIVMSSLQTHPVRPQERWFNSISSNLFANPSCSHLVVLDDLKRSGDNKAEAVNALPRVVEQVPRGATQQSLNQIQYIKYKNTKFIILHAW